VRGKVCLWISGFWVGVFLGALISCPAKHISLPSSLILAAALAYLGLKKR